MGRTKWLDLVRILALRTKPSLPTFVSSTNPIGHAPLGAHSSRIKTRSPRLTFGYGLNHFWRRHSSGKYSRNHRFQNWSTMYWTCLHRRRYVSLMCVIPHGYAKLPRNNKRWFGVSVASSSTSSLHFINGRLLIRFSTSHITVCSTSSVSLILVINNATKIWRMVRIIRSHRPPWWEAWGGLKDHSTFWRRALQMILLRSSLRKLLINSARAPTILVPLSDHTLVGFDLRATNRTNPLIKASVSILDNTSMWIARVPKQEYTQPYLFTLERPCTTLKGPKTSTPTNVNGGWPGSNLSGGKSAIRCTHGLAYNRLHTMQFRRIFFRIDRALIIQNLRRSWLSTHSVPTWQSPWDSWHINVLTRWSLGNMMGLFARLGTPAWHNRPPTTIKSLSHFGQSFARWLDFETTPRSRICSISSR